jgi:hypothetical protein
VPAVLEPSTDWTTPATPERGPVPEWARTVGKPRPIKAITPPITAALDIRKELNTARSYPSLPAAAPNFSGSSPRQRAHRFKASPGGNTGAISSQSLWQRTKNQPASR